MMHTRRTIMFSVALIGLGTAESQAEIIVQDMLPGCNAAATMDQSADNKTFNDASFCLGLMLGTMQLMSFNCSAIEAGFSTPPQLRAEMPPSTGAAAQAFVNWAKENPQAWDNHFVSGAIHAIREAFPCPK